MILLLGGTSETAQIAEALAQDHKVLVSTATDNALDVGSHPSISRRIGRLDKEGLKQLMAEAGISAVVDSAHPYAVELHRTAQMAAEESGLPYVAYLRPGSEYDYEKIVFARDHNEAAEKAFSFGRPVLLTTGSRNLSSYLAQARATGIPIVARVLPHEESHTACVSAGLTDSETIYARGPFSVEENMEVIRTHNIGVLVSKDSGSAGGVPEKIESARATGCDVVLIERPATDGTACRSIDELISAVREALQ